MKPAARRAGRGYGDLDVRHAPSPSVRRAQRPLRHCPREK
jgi:hypothetical protein